MSCIVQINPQYFEFTHSAESHFTQHSATRGLELLALRQSQGARRLGFRAIDGRQGPTNLLLLAANFFLQKGFPLLEFVHGLFKLRQALLSELGLFGLKLNQSPNTDQILMRSLIEL